MNEEIKEALMNAILEAGLKPTDAALKHKLKQLRREGNQQRKEVDKGCEEQHARLNDKSDKRNSTPFAHDNETDLDWEKRVFPKESQKLADTHTKYTKTVDRHDRVADRLAKRDPNNVSDKDKNFQSDISKHGHTKDGKISDVYKNGCNHWGWIKKSANESISERVGRLKETLIECGILEAQESNTAYEQAEREEKVFKKEDDKSFKEDRLDLEEILNNTGKKKKDYVRKVVKTINQMIDGKKDVENLIDVVKKRGK